MNIAALSVLAVASLWLICVAILMWLAPTRALNILRATASSRRVNNVEQGLRLLGGAALILRAPAAKAPWIFGIGGWFVVASSVALLVMPLRWHSTYARWWADRLRPWSVRAMAPLSAAAGLALAYLAI
jgi:hypothetical protein